MNNNEMVQLVREPDNPYDNWAVRVDNVSSRDWSVIVGKRPVCACLEQRPGLHGMHIVGQLCPALTCACRPSATAPCAQVRGQKVGHLPRVLVCHLAPLVDQGSLHLEGLVPRGGGQWCWGLDC